MSLSARGSQSSRLATVAEAQPRASQSASATPRGRAVNGANNGVPVVAGKLRPQSARVLSRASASAGRKSGVPPRSTPSRPRAHSGPDVGVQRGSRTTSRSSARARKGTTRRTKKSPAISRRLKSSPLFKSSIRKKTKVASSRSPYGATASSRNRRSAGRAAAAAALYKEQLEQQRLQRERWVRELQEQEQEESEKKRDEEWLQRRREAEALQHSARLRTGSRDSDLEDELGASRTPRTPRTTVEITNLVTGEWTRQWDDTNKAHFYINSSTGKSQWEKPREFVERPAPKPAPEPQQVEEQKWSRYWDDTHQAYYYVHKPSGVTTWEKPAEFQEAGAAQEDQRKPAAAPAARGQSQNAAPQENRRGAPALIARSTSAPAQPTDTSTANRPRSDGAAALPAATAPPRRTHSGQLRSPLQKSSRIGYASEMLTQPGGGRSPNRPSAENLVDAAAAGELSADLSRTRSRPSTARIEREKLALNELRDLQQKYKAGLNARVLAAEANRPRGSARTGARKPKMRKGSKVKKHRSKSKHAKSKTWTPKEDENRSEKRAGTRAAGAGSRAAKVRAWDVLLRDFHADKIKHKLRQFGQPLHGKPRDLRLRLAMYLVKRDEDGEDGGEAAESEKQFSNLSLESKSLTMDEKLALYEAEREHRRKHAPPTTRKPSALRAARRREKSALDRVCMAEALHQHDESKVFHLLSAKCDPNLCVGVLAKSDFTDQGYEMDAGTTAIHQAAACGFAQGVNVLLEFRASVDVTDQSGHTPLMMATKMQSVVDAVEKLGSDKHTRKRSGTPDFSKVIRSIDKTQRYQRSIVSSPKTVEAAELAWAAEDAESSGERPKFRRIGSLRASETLGPDGERKVELVPEPQ